METRVEVAAKNAEIEANLANINAALQQLLNNNNN